MTNLMQTYYEQAQLSDAAYAVLAKGMSRDTYEDALVQRGFTVEEAAAFAGKYSIIDTFVDDESSFFAVLFQEKDANGNGTNKKTLAIRGTNDPFDLFITDQQLALFGATSQSFAMRASYTDILAGLAPADMLTITGHSLGGFLAQALSADFSFPVSHVYTYNAPGLNSFLSNPFGQIGRAHV